MIDFTEIVRFGGTKIEQTELAQLVLKKEKTATSSLAELYILKQLPYPHVGDIWQIQDGHQQVICYVQVTKVNEKSFGTIDQTFAVAEGDGTYANWLHIHQTYYQHLLRQHNLMLTNTTPLVCCWFTLITD